MLGQGRDDPHALRPEHPLRDLRFDPSGSRPKERCTVGALRAESPDVDLSIRSSGKEVVPPEEPVTIVALLEKAAKLLEAASASPPTTSSPSTASGPAEAGDAA